jgi:tRNA modification GTPase
MRSDDTIFAIASGQGRAAVSVIRISGDQTRFVLETIAGKIPAPRRLTLRTLKDPAGEPLDQALVAWMPGPGSFTGEDQAELQIHGGAATRNAVIGVLARIEGCRAAEAGEFTRRAFLNGRMDLTQVEGLADLIDAETEAQRRQAMRQMEGELGHAAEEWREEGLQILALLEASLDFADEGDVPDGLEHQAMTRMQALADRIAKVLSSRSGERLREGLTVVIAGSPNAGKSTLLNRLAGRDVAIVSPFAGTTRDALEVRCDLGGLPVTFVDTAGLRETADPVEQEGVTRARQLAEQADLVLHLVAPDEDVPRLSSERQVLRVATKGDLNRIRHDCDLSISALSGEGLPELLERVEHLAQDMVNPAHASISRERHRALFMESHQMLQRAHSMLETNQAIELATEDVRLAVRALARVTGRLDVEDVLDRLFSGFCIGK